MRNTLTVINIDELAAFDGGKFVETREIKIVKHVPRRDMIRAALKLGIVVPGIKESNTDAVSPASVGDVVSAGSASPEIILPEFLTKK